MFVFRCKIRHTAYCSQNYARPVIYDTTPYMRQTSVASTPDVLNISIHQICRPVGLLDFQIRFPEFCGQSVDLFSEFCRIDDLDIFYFISAITAVRRTFTIK